MKIAIVNFVSFLYLFLREDTYKPRKYRLLIAFIVIESILHKIR